MFFGDGVAAADLGAVVVDAAIVFISSWIFFNPFTAGRSFLGSPKITGTCAGFTVDRDELQKIRGVLFPVGDVFFDGL